MANVKQAIDFVLRPEDSRLLGRVTTIKGDTGGATRFGIASHFHPKLVPEGFFDESRVNALQALAIAEDIYQKGYAAPLLISEIDDQALATAVLFGVNAGIGRAVLKLQRSVNLQGIPITIDGKMGPDTVRLVNQVQAGVLLKTFAILCSRF